MRVLQQCGRDLDWKGNALTASVQSVERAIRILKSFSLEKPERGVNELGRELGLHKSTVSRLMATLERQGLLYRNFETDRYRLGVDLIGLAAQVVSHLDVRQVAGPLLRELAEDCGETANLVVLDSDEVVNLEQYVPAGRLVGSYGWVGRRFPPHCTAVGKVLLAYLAQDRVEQILPATLEGFTDQTITDLDEFHQVLAQTRQQGYAVAQEELEVGLNVVAVPVFDHTDQVQSAASVSGPAYRMTPERFPEMAARLIGTAAEISRRLGYRASSQNNLPF